jgi:hypothetical protein
MVPFLTAPMPPRNQERQNAGGSPESELVASKQLHLSQRPPAEPKKQIIRLGL